MNRKISAFLLFILFVFASNLYAADIKVKVDRTQVELNETFTLVFEASEDPDDDPDFSPLEKDFQIVSQSSSSNISIINGDYSKIKRWSVSLMALKKGTVTIPSISFGSDHSPQYKITIKDVQQSSGKHNEDFMSELEVSSNVAYPQSQIIVTQRLLSNRNINAYEFSPLKINGVEAVTEPLGEVKQFQTRRGNGNYLVLEQNYAVYPQASGVLKIEPSVASARVSLNSSRSGYDPFRSNTQTIRRASAAKTITVKPIPSGFKGKHWLPAKEVQLVEELDDSKAFKVGEPITRTLSLFADGQTAAQLPEFTIAEIPGLKLYPDQPLTKDTKSDEGITGSQQIKVAIIPEHRGSFTLPEISIPWWNTQTHKQEIARIPARIIKVDAGSAKAAPVSPRPQSNPDVIVNSPAVTEKTSPAVALGEDSGFAFWKLTALLLATGWIVSLVIFWKFRHKKATVKSEPEVKTTSLKQSYRQLRDACEKSDAQACKLALLNWAENIFTEQPVYSLGELAQRVDKKLSERIISLNSHLYGRQNKQWKCGELVSLCEKYARGHTNSTQASDRDKLEDLYK